MIVLEERRANLQGELAQLDSQLESLRGRLGSGSPISTSRATSSAPAQKSAAKATRRGAKAGRGELKSQIFSALEKAGSSGIRVMDLAKSLGSKPANIYAWFHAAVKRYPTIKKVGNAQYRLVGSAPSAAPAKAKPAKRGRPGRPRKAAAQTKAAAQPKAKGKRGGGRRGALREKILASLKQAGSSGVRIKDLAKSLNVPNRNLQVWFATTGKKTPGVKKIAPGTFKLS